MNQVKTNYMAENISVLANLTWKELETIYYLRLPTLKDYARNLPNTPAPISEPLNTDIKSSGSKDKKTPEPISARPPDWQFNKSPSASSTTIDTSKESSTPGAVNQSTATVPGLDIAQTIKKHLQAPASTSPFAKLKSNNPAVREEASTQIATPQPTKPILPAKQPLQESNMEVAWFIEPAQTSSPEAIKIEPPQRAAGSSSPEENSAASLDAAIENAFGRMLKPAKKKGSQPDPPSIPPAVAQPKTEPKIEAELKTELEPKTEPELKLLPYSQTTTESPSQSQAAASHITESQDLKAMPPTPFDFSPAEERRHDTSAQSSVSKAELETGDYQPINLLDITASVTEKHDNESARKKQSGKDLDTSVPGDTFVSSDVLRNLIRRHIKHAAGQGIDSEQGQSIGTGKEFEVWLNNPARSKFIGGSKANEPVTPVKNSGNFMPRVVPADIRKSCLILGLRPENLSYEAVQESWKKSIALPGVHPDQGGDTEMAVYLNTAKDVLIRWLDAQAPKLGKKFGAPKKDDTK